MSAANTQTRLLRLAVKGLEIDVECIEGRVVDVVVRAHQQHRTAARRLLQHLANTLQRVAHNPRNEEGSVRITEVTVFSKPAQHLGAHGREHRVFWRLPSRSANGETHHQILAVHEGIEHRQRHGVAQLGIDGGRGKGGDDLHPLDLGGVVGKRVIVLPAPEGAAS